MDREVVSTQIRLPAQMHEYIKQEADRMGIAQNAFLVILLDCFHGADQICAAFFPCEFQIHT